MEDHIIPHTQDKECAKERIDRLRETGKIRKEVFIADDDEQSREQIKRALHACGYKIVEASSAKAADRILKSQPMRWIPEVIIMELKMAGGTGFDMISRLRDRFGSKNVPIIVCSAMADEDDIFESQVSGADGFVVKPFHPIDLLDAVALTLDNLKKPVTEKRHQIYVKKPMEAEQ